MKRWLCVLLLSCSSAWGDELVFRDQVALPDVKLEGKVAKVHTQGLVVLEDAFLITGRLEQSPKRPLLIRAPRKKAAPLEWMDLSQLLRDDLVKDKAELDHPGGFDQDAQGVFWIPLSTSHRRGPTVVVGLRISAEVPLARAIQVHKAFRLTDHVGAIACVGERLWAANWDTLKIYEVDKRHGKVVASHSWKSLFPAHDLALAVQDWKGSTNGQQILAGAIDKSKTRRPEAARAVVARLDLRHHTVQLTRLADRKDVTRPLTNEGLAVSAKDLYLVPEDFGRGAKVLRFALPASWRGQGR